MEEWKHLYELMDKVKQFAPWDLLDESDIFAVQDPETDEVGFVSIMGGAGEYFSIAVYRGEDALRKFWNLQEILATETTAAFEKLNEIPQLQAFWGERKDLYPEERAIIKKLGLTFRGKDSWPVFRSFEPGLVPWFINSAEARFLISVLEQTITVATAVEEDDEYLYPDEEDGYLLRTYDKNGSGGWQDSVWHESTEPPPQIEFFSDMIAFEKLKSLPIRDIALEIDIFMFPHGVRDKDERPYYPYNLMFLDTQKGLILSQEMLTPLPNLEAMWQEIPNVLAHLFINMSFVPNEIYVESENLYYSLMHLQGILKSSVNFVERLLIAPQVRESFLRFANK